MKRRRAWPVAALAAVGLLFLAGFPARTYLTQRRTLSATEARVHLLSKENAALSSRVRKLHTDAEIERLAREQFNLVRPGEEAYALLPAPEPPVPATRPRPAPKSPSFWSKAWDTVTFWD